jgi:hypothetical protein
LTPGQRWIATAARDPESALPIQRLYRLSGDLDTRRLLGALRSVLAENEALRLRLHGSEGRWEQSFPDREPVIDAVAPTGGSSARRLDWTLGYLAQAASKAQDLDGTGPFSIQLVRLDRDTHILGLTVDHLAVDAAGFDLLENRLHAAYRGEVRPSPAGTFRAYLANEHISEAERSRALGYWLDLLTHLPDTPSSGGRVRGKRATLTWKGRPLSDCLAACRRTRWSPFTALLAAQALLMAQLAGRRQVVINTPFSNRVTDEERDLLANLAILVHLPIRLLPDESMQQFRARLRNFVIVSMAHRNYDAWELSVGLACATEGNLETVNLVAGCNFVKSPAADRLGEPMSLEAMLPFSLRSGTFLVTCEESDQQFDLELLWDPDMWPLTDGSELFSAFRLVTCSDGSQMMSELLGIPPRPHR